MGPPISANLKRHTDTQAMDVQTKRRKSITKDQSEIKAVGDTAATVHSTPRVFVFASDPNAGKKTIRKPFETWRREEVATTRKFGACTECRNRKRPCSSGWPCRLCAEKPLCVQPCIKTNFAASDFFGRCKLHPLNMSNDLRF